MPSAALPRASTARTRRHATRLAALVLLCAARAAAPGTLPANVAALIGDARCDVDAQCRSIAVGSQRCGGASGYLAWSTQRTDAAALARAVDAAAADSSANGGARNSTCGVVADPGAYCARPAAAGSAPPDGVSATGRCRLRARAASRAGLPDR
jgi:hypothetical protein